MPETTMKNHQSKARRCLLPGRLLQRWSVTLALIVTATTTATATPTLRQQLETLARSNHFDVRGLEHLRADEPSAATLASAGVREQLKTLLVNYNYYVVGSASIRELVISSHLQPQTARPLYNHVKTTRSGANHQVDAMLVGPNNVPMPATLVVDTGASAVVLPLSQAAELGFDVEALNDGTARTAGGVVPVKIANLLSVKIGNMTASQVQVNFIPDERLGQTRLLGMSFLDRFRVTIDDSRQELILNAR